MPRSPAPRDALVDALLPTGHAGLPPVDPAHRASFWRRFDAVAPWTLRLALGLTATHVRMVVLRVVSDTPSVARGA